MLLTQTPPITSKPYRILCFFDHQVFGIKVEVPCVDNIGSCNYDDVCSMIPPTPSSGCPPPLPTYKIPCACPVPKVTQILIMKNFFFKTNTNLHFGHFHVLWSTHFLRNSSDMTCIQLRALFPCSEDRTHDLDSGSLVPIHDIGCFPMNPDGFSYLSGFEVAFFAKNLWVSPVELDDFFSQGYHKSLLFILCSVLHL